MHILEYLLTTPENHTILRTI